MTFKLVRVKTESSFTADDPWNQNRRTSFNIELYVLTPGGAPPNAKRLGGYNRFYAIRSEVDGIERMLPESLAYLWGKKSVLAETLPRLLKGMEPMLKRVDFRRQLLTRKAAFLMYALTGLYALILLIAGSYFLSGPNVDMVDGLLVAVPALFFGSFLYLVLFRQRGRRRRQVDWALAHL